MLEDFESRRVGEWQELYDWLYQAEDKGPQSRQDFRGWTSSATRDPIQITDMHEWVEATVLRIKSLSPNSIYEIGVGTGLLLDRLWSKVDHYFASDFSKAAIEYILRKVQEPSRVFVREATDYSALPFQRVDTVVLNSVCQYFPSEAYLKRVLTGAIDVLDECGTIFIGDVRSLPLADLQYLEIALGDITQARADCDVLEVIKRKCERERELLLAPEYFVLLGLDVPEIKCVDIRFKESSHMNEMTKYRYDVVLGLEEPQESFLGANLVYRSQELSNEHMLRSVLRGANGRSLKILGVKNSRVSRFVEEYEDLSMKSPKVLKKTSVRAPAMDFEAYRTIGRGEGYNTIVRPSSADELSGTADILFTRYGGPVDSSDLVTRSKGEPGRLFNRPAGI